MKRSIEERDIIEGKFWIWGAGDHGKDFLEKLIFLEVDVQQHVLGILDSDPHKTGERLYGIRIDTPSHWKHEIVSGEDVVIVICGAKQIAKEIAREVDRDFQNVRYIVDDDVPFTRNRDFTRHFGSFMPCGNDKRLISRCCRRDDWDRIEFVNVLKRMEIYDSERHIRKPWELGFIVETLDRAGVLKPGKRGFGFAVGEELLPSYFASLGVDVLASDLSLSELDGSCWLETGQNAGGDVEKLWKPNLCSKKAFKSHVRYRDVNMNHIPENEKGYDFCWSVCAIEHVGTLKLSLEFMKNVLRVLKPGGISIHTTEFNLSSNNDLNP